MLVFSYFGTVAALALGAWLAVPDSFRHGFCRLANRLMLWLDSSCSVIVDEFEGPLANRLYDQVRVSLGGADVAYVRKRTAFRGKHDLTERYGLADGEMLPVHYEGARFDWTHHVHVRQSQSTSWNNHGGENRVRKYVLRTLREHRPKLQAYLKNVEERANELAVSTTELHVYSNIECQGGMNRRKLWEAVPFRHPSTFDTLALAAVSTTALLSRINDWRDGRNKYAQTGRAHKLGILLHGPVRPSKTIASPSSLLSTGVVPGMLRQLY